MGSDGLVANCRRQASNIANSVTVETGVVKCRIVQNAVPKPKQAAGECRRSMTKMFKAPHSLRQWFRVGSWTLIAIAIIAFFVVMWLPSHPMWLIITVSAVFIVGVLSLFFTAGDSKHNPNLDENGTAV